MTTLAGAFIGAVVAFAVFVGWVWWEWCIRPVWIARNRWRNRG